MEFGLRNFIPISRKFKFKIVAELGKPLTMALYMKIIN